MPRLAGPVEGMAGKVSACTKSATTPSTPVMTKADRQPIISPTHAPTGAAQTVAADTPPMMMAIARGISRSGTSRIAKASDMAQNPPRPIPRRARDKSSIVMPLDKAAIRLDTISSVVRPKSV